MSHRVNIILKEEVWQAFQELPRGERSRLANHALARELARVRRRRAAEALEMLGRELPAEAGPAETWIREDRDRH